MRLATRHFEIAVVCFVTKKEMLVEDHHVIQVYDSNIMISYYECW